MTSSTGNSTAARIVLAAVWLRVGMSTPSIILGIALPSNLSRELWWLLGGLAIVYAAVGWFYSVAGVVGAWILVLLGLTDFIFTAIEFHSDLHGTFTDQHSVFVAIVVLDVIQFVLALIVTCVAAWTIRQHARLRPGVSVMESSFALHDGGMVRVNTEDESAG